jgi:hypothetical protein
VKLRARIKHVLPPLSDLITLYCPSWLFARKRIDNPAPVPLTTGSLARHMVAAGAGACAGRSKSVSSFSSADISLVDLESHFPCNIEDIKEAMGINGRADKAKKLKNPKNCTTKVTRVRSYFKFGHTYIAHMKTAFGINMPGVYVKPDADADEGAVDF